MDYVYINIQKNCARDKKEVLRKFAEKLALI